MSGPAPIPHHGSIGFNLGAIMLSVAFAGLGFAYLVDSLGHPRHADPGTAGLTLTRTIGGADLEIPADWFRRDEQRIDGFAKQIDLRVPLPLGADGAILPVDVTLLPRSRVRPSASLLDGVYLHQFGMDQITGPPGLVGKPLAAGGGYTDETVWYDALSADPFVAKCSKTTPDAAQAQCLRTVYLGPGMAAIYAFPDTALAQWRQFDPQMSALLQRIGAL